MRRRSASISVLCLTNGPMERVARILSQLRGVADQIVCGIDSRADPEEIVALDGVVDETFRCEIGPESLIERTLPWLHSKCSCEWIFRIDGDEMVGDELRHSLPALAADGELQQYSFPARWLSPDGTHYLTDRPWNDDWHIRLMRNNPAALRFRGSMRPYVEPALPYRYVDFPIYRLECAISSFNERRAKAAYYEMLGPGDEALPGWSVNNFYLPERFHAGRLEDLAPRDRTLIERALSARNGRTHPPAISRSRARTRHHLEIVSLAESDAQWPLRTVRDSAYRAAWLRVPEIKAMPVHGIDKLLVEVRNDGEETWPFGDGQPMIRLAQRWLSADGESVVLDSARTLFSTAVRPGESILQHMTVRAPPKAGRFVLELDLVHERVRWFGCGVRYEVDVRPDSSSPAGG
jgi:hypothetical protein